MCLASSSPPHSRRGWCEVAASEAQQTASARPPEPGRPARLRHAGAVRKRLAVTVGSLVLVLAGCSAGEPAPEATQGAATASATTPAASPSPTPTPGSTPSPTPSPSPAPTESPQPNLIGQSLEWSDGTSVEVTKIKRGKVTAEHVDWNDDLKIGQAYVIITVKLTNGTTEQIDLMTEASLSYGPDGDEATDTYLSEDTEAGAPDGVLPPERSRSGFFVFLVPQKHQDDVVLGLTPSLDHDEATFTGSLT